MLSFTYAYVFNEAYFISIYSQTFCKVIEFVFFPLQAVVLIILIFMYPFKLFIILLICLLSKTRNRLLGL